MSNDGGTERVTYVPTGTEFLDKCVDENGEMTTGLTIEGELNKVRKLKMFLLASEYRHGMHGE